MSPSFHLLCQEPPYVKGSHGTDISTDMSEDQVAEDRDMNLDEKQDIILDTIREAHWRDVAEEDEDKKKIHDLRWEVYVKGKEKLIKSKVW